MTSTLLKKFIATRDRRVYLHRLRERLDITVDYLLIDLTEAAVTLVMG